MWKIPNPPQRPTEVGFRALQWGTFPRLSTSLTSEDSWPILLWPPLRLVPSSGLHQVLSAKTASSNLPWASSEVDFLPFTCVETPSGLPPFLLLPRSCPTCVSPPLQLKLCRKPPQAADPSSMLVADRVWCWRYPPSSIALTASSHSVPKLDCQGEFL